MTTGNIKMFYVIRRKYDDIAVDYVDKREQMFMQDIENAHRYGTLETATKFLCKIYRVHRVRDIIENAAIHIVKCVQLDNGDIKELVQERELP